MTEQDGLGVEKEQDSPGGPPAKPASGKPVQAQACHQEGDEISKVPDIRCENRGIYPLNNPDQQGCQGNKSRSVTLVG